MKVCKSAPYFSLYRPKSVAGFHPDSVSECRYLLRNAKGIYQVPRLKVPETRLPLNSSSSCRVEKSIQCLLKQ